MNISTTELVIVLSFFALLSLLRHQRRPKDAVDIETIRALIRSEVSQLGVDAQRQLLDEIAKSMQKEGARQRLTN